MRSRPIEGRSASPTLRAVCRVKPLLNRGLTRDTARNFGLAERPSIGLDRIVHRGKEVLGSKPATNTEPDQTVLDRTLHLGEHQADAQTVQIVVELDQIIDRGGVDSGDGLRRDDDPAHWLGCFRDQGADEGVEDTPVGEEQGSVKACLLYTSDAISLRVPAQIVVSGHAVDAHQLRAVRVPRPPHKRHQRQADGHDDALKHSYESDAEEPVSYTHLTLPTNREV